MVTKDKISLKEPKIATIECNIRQDNSSINYLGLWILGEVLEERNVNRALIAEVLHGEVREQSYSDTS